jgi:hypothetical protein
VSQTFLLPAFFFARFPQEESIGTLRRLLLAPSFDPHRREEIVRLIGVARAGQPKDERAQLRATVRGVTSASELEGFLRETNLAAVLADDSLLTSYKVDVAKSDSLLDAVAERIYHIR